MHYLWNKRIKENRRAEGKRQTKAKRLRWFWGLIVILLMLYPQSWKRLVYPILIGKKVAQPQEISQKDYYEVLEKQKITIERGGKKHQLLLNVAYSVTGRIGIVEHYDGWWNRLYRGHSQKDYINLVPRDIVLVIGKMAEPDIFKMFDFVHEERNGGVKCKGVKYKDSFMSFYKDRNEAIQSETNYKKCSQYFKEEEYTNYHPIPATENINRVLSMLIKGDVVSLEGFLLGVPDNKLSDIERRKLWTYDDMVVNGIHPRKCFTIYVTKIIVNGVEYE